MYFVSNQLFFCNLANQSPGRRAGSINDYDPVNENYGSQGQQGYRLTGQQPTQYAQQQQQQQTQQQQQQTQQQKLQQYYQQQQRQHALHVQQQQAMQQQAMQQQQQVMQQQQQALQQQQQQAMQQQQALRHQQHTMSQQSSYTGSVGVSSGYHQAANTQPRSSGVNWMTLIVKLQYEIIICVIFYFSVHSEPCTTMMLTMTTKFLSVTAMLL